MDGAESGLGLLLAGAGAIALAATVLGSRRSAAPPRQRGASPAVPPPGPSRGRPTPSIPPGSFVDPGDVPAKAVSALIATGVPMLDRPPIRDNVAKAAIDVFGLGRVLADVRIPRALMAIVWKESGGNPRFYLGDLHAKHGPSIGPAQIYRASAERLGLWQPPPGTSDAEAAKLYAKLSHDEARGIQWGAIEFAHDLQASGGDLVDAIRRYNGTGPHAEAYRDKILAWARQSPRGWDLASPPRPATNAVA